MRHFVVLCNGIFCCSINISSRRRNDDVLINVKRLENVTKNQQRKWLQLLDQNDPLFPHQTMEFDLYRSVNQVNWKFFEKRTKNIIQKPNSKKGEEINHSMNEYYWVTLAPDVNTCFTFSKHSSHISPLFFTLPQLAAKSSLKLFNWWKIISFFMCLVCLLSTF